MYMTNEEKEYKRSFEEAQEFFNNFKIYNYQEVEDGLDKYANVPAELVEKVNKDFDTSPEMAEKISQSMKVEDYQTTTAALTKNVHFDEEIFNKVANKDDNTPTT